MEFAELKSLYKKNANFPTYEIAKVQNGFAYVLNHFICGRYQLQTIDELGIEAKTLEDGLYRLDKGTVQEEKNVRHEQYHAVFSSKYEKESFIEVKGVSVISLRSAIKRLKAFSTEEKVLLLMHDGKFKIAWKDEASRCEVEVMDVDPSIQFFSFVDIKLWDNVFKTVQNEEVMDIRFYTDPIVRVVIENVADLFIIGKDVDKKYF